MAGRNTKLTPETQALICNAIRAGNYNVVAAEYGGINEKTFYAWMKQGEAAKSGIYYEFCKAVKKAEADAETQRIARISKAGADGTWQADAWWAERKFPERWGRQVQDVNHSGGVTIRVEYVDTDT